MNNKENKYLNEVYPNKGESKKDFIARFMEVTKDEYPDVKQRYAVALSYWSRRNKVNEEEHKMISEFLEELNKIDESATKAERLAKKFNAKSVPGEVYKTYRLDKREDADNLSKEMTKKGIEHRRNSNGDVITTEKNRAYRDMSEDMIKEKYSEFLGYDSDEFYMTYVKEDGKWKKWGLTPKRDHYAIERYLLTLPHTEGDVKKRPYEEVKFVDIDEDGNPLENISEDTIKTKSGKWVNKGKEGTHGTFKTKKEADQQRKAMFANKKKGAKWGESLKEYRAPDYKRKEAFDRLTSALESIADMHFDLGYGKLNRKEFEEQVVDKNTTIEGYRNIANAHIIDMYKIYSDHFDSLSSKNESLKENYETLSGTKVTVFVDLDEAEKEAKKRGLHLAEYGNYYDRDFFYSYWNKSGDRNDDEEVFAIYAFDNNGKPRRLTKDEAEEANERYELGIDIDSIYSDDDADESLKEEYGPHKGSYILDAIARDVEEGNTVGSVRILDENEDEKDVGWTLYLTINGEEIEDLNLSTVTEDYFLEYCSYPIKDGFDNYYDVEATFDKTSDIPEEDLRLMGFSRDDIIKYGQGEDVTTYFTFRIEFDDEDFELDESLNESFSKEGKYVYVLTDDKDNIIEQFDDYYEAVEYAKNRDVVDTIEEVYMNEDGGMDWDDAGICWTRDEIDEELYISLDDMMHDKPYEAVSKATGEVFHIKPILKGEKLAVLVSESDEKIKVPLYDLYDLYDVYDWEGNKLGGDIDESKKSNKKAISKISESVDRREVLSKVGSYEIIKDGYGFGIDDGTTVNRFFVDNDGVPHFDYEPTNKMIRKAIDKLVNSGKLDNPHYKGDDANYVGNTLKYGRGVEEGFIATKDQLEEINNICNRIGIETVSDLDHFKKEMGCENCSTDKLIELLREYEKELGDDFKIEESVKQDIMDLAKSKGYKVHSVTNGTTLNYSDGGAGMKSIVGKSIKDLKSKVEDLPKLSEEVSECKGSINIRESLNDIDNSNYNQYDLRNLYDSQILSEEKKVELAKLLHENKDAKEIYKFLTEGLNEEEEEETVEETEEKIEEERGNAFFIRKPISLEDIKKVKEERIAIDPDSIGDDYSVIKVVESENIQSLGALNSIAEKYASLFDEIGDNYYDHYVIKVRTPEGDWLIDTNGYDYARYVAFVEKE